VISCANCESPQFLQIVQSRIYYEDMSDADSIEEIEEKYVCTLCGSEGSYEYSDGEESISGDVEDIDEIEVWF
jgi:hypothetical protein